MSEPHEFLAIIQDSELQEFIASVGPTAVFHDLWKPAVGRMLCWSGVHESRPGRPYLFSIHNDSDAVRFKLIWEDHVMNILTDDEVADLWKARVMSRAKESPKPFWENVEFQFWSFVIGGSAVLIAALTWAIWFSYQNHKFGELVAWLFLSLPVQFGINWLDRQSKKAKE